MIIVAKIIPMFRTRIKICGVMRPQDAAAAARHGADAIGMIFHEPAKRYVRPDRAREIIAAIPVFVTPVAVFVDASPQTILQQSEECGMQTVQLHGGESPEVIGQLRHLNVLKAVHVEPETFHATLQYWADAIRKLKLTNLKGIVLETAGASGGSGQANNWTAVKESIDSGFWSSLPPMIAAGGLTPDTVGKVVQEIHPYAVDTSSGVEESVGVKSDEKIRAFIRAVRADTTL